jgi:hypothetical protein
MKTSPDLLFFEFRTIQRTGRKPRKVEDHQTECNLVFDHIDYGPIAQPALVQSSSMHIVVRKVCKNQLSSKRSRAGGFM